MRAVNEAAFGQREEADLVERLHADGAVLDSLVAVRDNKVAGHILFSRMFIDTPAGAVAACALAPMAVSPSCQRQGIGAALIRAGLDAMRARGERIVLVVGHANYYPRFGFSTERARALASPFPPAVFMALELVPGALAGVSGPVRYAAAFGLPASGR